MNEAATRTLSLRYDYRQTALSNLLIPDLVSPDDQHVRLSTLSGTYVCDTRDQPLDAHKGMYQTVELGINPTRSGIERKFRPAARAAGLLQGSWERDSSGQTALRIGVEQEFAGSRVPVSELFFSGGGSTLRGFPLNGAGPQRSVHGVRQPVRPRDLRPDPGCRPAGANCSS